MKKLLLFTILFLSLLFPRVTVTAELLPENEVAVYYSSNEPLWGYQLDVSPAAIVGITYSKWGFNQYDYNSIIGVAYPRPLCAVHNGILIKFKVYNNDIVNLTNITIVLKDENDIPYGIILPSIHLSNN